MLYWKFSGDFFLKKVFFKLEAFEVLNIGVFKTSSVKYKIFLNYFFSKFSVSTFQHCQKVPGCLAALSVNERRARHLPVILLPEKL